ncbi:MAG TPA: rod shape-determining protein MreC [Patescibacteria group bacterium]|nr:rod shape-determining protein MreC [Patescibacteria group bacterium]
MRERKYLFPVFLFCLAAVFFLFILGRFGALFFLENSIQTVIFPLSSFARNQTTQKLLPKPTSIQEENVKLNRQVAALAQLAADNKALRDQFQTENPTSQELLPAIVVGMPGAIPNISFPETLILDKGLSDGIRLDEAVVDTNQLIGTITQISDHFSLVTLITSTKSSLSVKDVQTGAIGVAKGQGNGVLLMDNVLLSDTLHANDFVASLGSQNLSGKGVVPGLILGKIVSVDKKPSNLFQSAQVTPLIAFDRLSRVFIVK